VRELQNVLGRLMVLSVNEGNLDEFVCSIDASQQHPFKFTQYLSSLGNQFADLSSLQLKKIRKEAKNQIDKILIEYALRKTAGNRKAAYKLLEISYRSLLSKMEDLDIQPILLFNN
jgi:transcriptional regulator with PAS, ATPase and Fis domain